MLVSVAEYLVIVIWWGEPG